MKRCKCLIEWDLMWDVTDDVIALKSEQVSGGIKGLLRQRSKFHGCHQWIVVCGKFVSCTKSILSSKLKQGVVSDTQCSS